MGEDEAGGRRGGGIFALRATAAFVALGAVAGLAADLAGKAGRPGASSATAAPAPSPVPVPADPPRNRAAAADERTVYDERVHLERCARSFRTMGAASTRPGLADDIRRISARVERIRGLRFARTVDTRLVPRPEVGERFARGYRRRFSAAESAAQGRVLAALGLAPEGADLREIGTGVVSEAVAGFYSPRRNRLFAGATGPALTPFDEVVLAHELDHALVDQALGLPMTLSRDPLLADVMLAHQALTEGDATLLMSRYAWARLGPDGAGSFLARFADAAVTPPEGVPYALVRASEFPYAEGLLFACGAWRRGGWDAIDALYARPPDSTAQVVFPPRYRSGAEVSLPPAPAAPRGRWREVVTASLGVFDLMLLLENADLVSDGETRPGGHVDDVRGWAGGVLRAWGRGEETAIHIALVDRGVAGDGGRRRRLCGVLRGWYRETFAEAVPATSRLLGIALWRSPAAGAGLHCKGRHVQLAIAPERRLVERLLRDTASPTRVNSSGRHACELYEDFAGLLCCAQV